MSELINPFVNFVVYLSFVSKKLVLLCVTSLENLPVTAGLLEYDLVGQFKRKINPYDAAMGLLGAMSLLDFVDEQDVEDWIERTEFIDEFEEDFEFNEVWNDHYGPG